MNKETFEELIFSVREAGRIRRGEAAPSRRFVRDSRDVRQVREGLGVSQHSFARLIGVSVNTVQNWEQGRRTPTGPARVLLYIAEHNPSVFADLPLGAARAGETAAELPCAK